MATARGLRLVADAFYRGPIARRIDAWSRSHGGLIRYVDLATHTTRIEDPVAVTYRGQTVYKCGPWTQGPYLLEALQILKDIDLKAHGHNRPATIHALVETMKLAMADRDTFYADPHFADVPLSALLSSEYAALRRGLIDPGHASLVRRPGDPLGHHAVLDPAADPAQRHISSTSLARARHDDVPGGRPVRQRGGRNAQRMDRGRRRRYRRLAGQPAPELQPLGRPSQRHRAGQTSADYLVARHSCCVITGPFWPSVSPEATIRIR